MQTKFSCVDRPMHTLYNQDVFLSMLNMVKVTLCGGKVEVKVVKMISVTA